MRSTVIYGLVDPRTNELRYIGKTVASLRERLNLHIAKIPTQRNHRTAWLKKLTDDGLVPDIIEIETVSSERSSWVEAEMFWIAYFRFIGARLVNTTHGGDGFGIEMPVEMKNKIRKALAGKPKSEETKHRMRIARIRYFTDPNNHARLSAACLGRKHTEESRAKLSAAGMGRTASKETRDKQSKALKGRPGKGHTPESKAKIGASLRRYHESRSALNPLSGL